MVLPLLRGFSTLSYYPHRSREMVSPVCGILFSFFSTCLWFSNFVLLSASVERVDVSRMRDFFAVLTLFSGFSTLSYYPHRSRELVSPVYGIFVILMRVESVPEQ